MKLTFNRESSEWLYRRISQIIVISAKHDNVEDMHRTARKMRHKFSGNSVVVYLTGKERDLIKSLVTYRLESIGPSPSDEYTTLKAIKEVLDAA